MIINLYVYRNKLTRDLSYIPELFIYRFNFRFITKHSHPNFYCVHWRMNTFLLQIDNKTLFLYLYKMRRLRSIQFYIFILLTPISSYSHSDTLSLYRNGIHHDQFSLILILSIYNLYIKTLCNYILPPQLQCLDSL